MKKMVNLLILLIMLVISPVKTATQASLVQNVNHTDFVKPQNPVTKKLIALTFDADMTTGMQKGLNSGKDKSLYNAEIIKFLRQEKIPATLFITGLWAKEYPFVIKDLASDSLFEIGNHSYSHRAFTKSCFKLGTLANKDKEADVLKAQEILTKLSGKSPKLFRFPGGCANSEDKELVEKLGLKVVGWTLASGDAFNSNTKAIIDNVEKNAKAGSVIVFHLSGGRYAPKTLDVLKVIIPELKKRNFEFVTFSNLSIKDPNLKKAPKK